MELSVEEIIAKVALQRQKLTQTQKQQQLLNQIHNNSIHNNSIHNNSIHTKHPTIIHTKHSTIIHTKHSTVNHTKHPTVNHTKQPTVNHTKQPTVNHTKQPINPLNNQTTPNTTTISKKYKQLQAIYKKLKIQISAQLKIDNKYSQLMENLTKVIYKNSKLQTELDGLRMKQSIIVQNQKSLNEDNQKRNKNQKWMVTQYGDRSVQKSLKGIKSRGSIAKCEDYCKCENGQYRQKHIDILKEQAPTKHQSLKDNSAARQQGKTTTIKEPAIPGPEELTAQILQYKSLIGQKQSSIDKLESIMSKQQQLIKQYEAQWVCSGPKAGQIRSKQARQGNGRKVEGTIVKMKRGNAVNGLNQGNRAVTDRRQMFPTSHYQFLSPSYVQGQEEKTRKKQQFRQVPNRKMPTGSPVLNPHTSHPYTYIQSIPSQQQSHQHYLHPQFHSPSSSINETSEFMCGELQ